MDPYTLMKVIQLSKNQISNIILTRNLACPKIFKVLKIYFHKKILIIIDKIRTRNPNF